VWVALAACLLSACSFNPPLDLAAMFPGYSPVLLAPVPFYPQREYQCGPAALASVLGAAGVSTSPAALAPTGDEELQWPMWGVHYVTRGEKGSEPDLAPVQELLRLLKDWRRAPDRESRALVWHKMLKLYTDEVFTIGILNGTLAPIVANARIKNIPESAFYGFDPTCYFGVYRADTFFYEDGAA